MLDAIENFMVRRWVCHIPTHTLNEMFPALYAQAAEHSDFAAGVKLSLASKSYPRDAEFRDRLVNARLYSAGEGAQKTKLLLCRVEESFHHREAVDPAALTVEHVMPQTLTAWWRDHLGDSADDVSSTRMPNGSRNTTARHPLQSVSPRHFLSSALLSPGRICIEAARARNSGTHLSFSSSVVRFGSFSTNT